MYKIVTTTTTTETIIVIETTFSTICYLVKVYHLDKEIAKTAVNAAKKSGTAYITGREIWVDYEPPKTHDACPSHRNCWYCLHADLCPVWLDTGTTPLQISEYGEIIE